MRLALHQDLQDLKTQNRQVRKVGSKRFNIRRSIMKAARFHFRNLEPYQSLHRFILPFVNIHVGKLPTCVTIAHVQKVPFLQMHK